MGESLADKVLSMDFDDAARKLGAAETRQSELEERARSRVRRLGLEAADYLRQVGIPQVAGIRRVDDVIRRRRGSAWLIGPLDWGTSGDTTRLFCSLVVDDRGRISFRRTLQARTRGSYPTEIVDVRYVELGEQKDEWWLGHDASGAPIVRGHAPGSEAELFESVLEREVAACVLHFQRTGEHWRE